jgi:hypothetical protein
MEYFVTVIHTKYLFILGVVCLISFQGIASAQQHDASVEECIAGHSGADSLECLEKKFFQAQKRMASLEKKIRGQLNILFKIHNLTGAHHEMAVSSLKDASRKFAKFSERQCDFATGASGAAASGAGQIRWSCLIQLNDWRIRHLQVVLAELHKQELNYRALP